MAPIGAPVSWPRENEIEAASGMPAAMNRSASRRSESRVTKASPVRFAAYAVLKAQLPAPR